MTRVTPIKIDPGINRILRFAPDGRPALVSKAWRDEGGGSGYFVQVVMLPSKTGAGDWHVVEFDRHGRAMEDVLADDNPKGGKHAASSVRLVHAVFDGSYETLALMATRDTGGLFGDPDDPVRVNFEIYKLTRPTPGASEYFALVDSTRSAEKYCDSEMALHQHFKIALAATYSGPKSVDGCP